MVPAAPVALVPAAPVPAVPAPVPAVPVTPADPAALEPPAPLGGLADPDEQLMTRSVEPISKTGMDDRMNCLSEKGDALPIREGAKLFAPAYARGGG